VKMDVPTRSRTVRDAYCPNRRRPRLGAVVTQRYDTTTLLFSVKMAVRCGRLQASATRVAPLTAILATLCAACQQGDLAGFPTFPQARPFEVVTFAHPNFMRVGDTLTASSFAYDSTGYVTMPTAARVWRLSDSTVVRLEASNETGGRLVRAISPGVSRVTATIAGLSGGDTVWVVPSNAAVHIQTSSTKVALGDTLIATCTLSNSGGVPVPVGRIIPLNSGSALAEIGRADTLGHWRVIAFESGVVRLTATLGNLVDTISVTVAPRP
jgi:hypothetical protein